MKRVTWREFVDAVEARGVLPDDIVEIALAGGSWHTDVATVSREREWPHSEADKTMIAKIVV